MARQLHPSSIAEARQSLSAMERNPRAVNRAGHTGIRSARNYLDRAEQAHAAGNTTEAAQHYASAQRAIRQIPDPDLTRQHAAWAHTAASRATEARALEQERQQRIAHDFTPMRAASVAAQHEAASRPKAITQTQHGTATTHTPHDLAMHQAVQRGAKGGTFVVTKSGKKRYVKKA